MQGAEIVLCMDPTTTRRGCVHMLNGTAIAVSRIIIATYENYQNPDGSVRIPEALAFRH